MRVRVLILCALLQAVATAQVPPQQPAQQPPIFRGGVELLTVDATVVDGDGKQLTDLKAADFTVEVDGNARPIVSAEYVKMVDDTPIPVGARRAAAPQAPADEAFYSTNSRTVTPGRMILLLVDQGNIRAGQGRTIMRSAVKFVDSLHPNDRVGLVAVPGPGALVDFTTDHEKVREGLLATVGRATPFTGRFHISITEALATVENSDPVLVQSMVMRECAGALSNPAAAVQCEIDVEQECSEMVSQMRWQTQNSLRSIKAALQALAGIEGPKSVILISEGLITEGFFSDADDIASVAADVRASLDVMLLDVPTVDVADSQRPTTPREDRELQVRGLEEIAGASRGSLHRIFGTGEQAFTRIGRSMAGYYLIAVEARPSDRDGKRHRISVKTSRKGATLLSRRGFLAPMSPGASTPTEAVSRALRAPLTLNDVPMRIATWTYKEPGTARVRVLVTAEVERTPTQALDYTTGFILVDRNNKVISTAVEKKTLLESDADPTIAVFSGAIAVDPGTYRLRFAAADSEGRLGSVERKLDAWQMDGPGLTAGDLLLGPVRENNAPRLIPAIEPQIASGRMAAMVEVYGGAPQVMEGLSATLDVLPADSEKPITSTPMHVSQGNSSEVGTVQAMLSTSALPPGRYLARATIVQGGKAQGHFVRPFRVVAGGAADAAVAGAYTPTALPPQLAEAILRDFPTVERKSLLTPAVMNAVLASAEKARPAAGAKAALATARGGKFGPAALAALEGGDQVLAAFLRGIDFFSQGQVDRAGQQFNLVMQQAPTFGPVRMYLGAILSMASRHREAASLLSSVPEDVTGAAPVARMAAINWLQAGDAGLAIESLEKGLKSGDPDAPRALALAYIVGNRPADALPLLVTHLETQPSDQPALLAGLYATYALHAGQPRADTLAADRARAQTWAKSYTATGGGLQSLIQAWMKHLEGLK